jgi:hypothetical protein
MRVVVNKYEKLHPQRQTDKNTIHYGRYCYI